MSLHGFNRPFRLQFLHRNVKGLPLLRFLIRCQNMGEVRGGRLKKGVCTPPMEFLEPVGLLLVAHSAEKAESLPTIGGREWTNIGCLEGWL